MQFNLERIVSLLYNSVTSLLLVGGITFATIGCLAPDPVALSTPISDGSSVPALAAVPTALDGIDPIEPGVVVTTPQSASSSAQSIGGSPLVWGAATPEMPLLDSAAGEFDVAVRHMFIDGECVGDNNDDADGITLTIRGTITHHLPDRIHSATLRGIVFAEFGTDAKVLRSSNGMGFVEDVTSNEPWEQGIPREFEVVTRPIDPIYCLYSAERAAGALYLSTRSPLGEQRSVTVSVQPFTWQPLSGHAVAQTALALRNMVLDSPYTRASVTEGSLVDVIYVRRGRGLFRHESGLVGWAAIDGFEIGGPAVELPFILRTTASFPESGVELSDIAITPVGSESTMGSTLTMRASFTNISTSRRRNPFDTLRVMQSDGESLRPRVICEVADGCGQNIEPGLVLTAQLSFELTDNQRPVAIGVISGVGQSLVE